MYGEVIMQRRIELGWTREKFADLYGLAIRDRTVSVKAIENMEKYGNVPKNPKRRYVLAGLLGLAPTMLGLPAPVRVLEDLMPKGYRGSIDLIEYTRTLRIYQENRWVKMDDVAGTVADILGRVNVLHNKVFYSGPEKMEMLQLLGNFHLVLADIAADQRYGDTEASFNKAVMLAQDYQLYSLLPIALYRRGAFLQDNGNAEAAREDFLNALKIKNIPHRLKGSILGGLSVAKSRCTKDKQDIHEALHLMDESAKLTSTSIDDETYKIKFDEERWHLDRAAVLIGSPVRKHRDTEAALDELAYVQFPDDTRRSQYRETYSNVLQARISLDKGDYSFATELARDSLSIMNEMSSYVHVLDVQRLYNNLIESKYKSSEAVATLGVELVKAKNADIFKPDLCL